MRVCCWRRFGSLCTAPNAAVQNQEKLVRLHCYLPPGFLVKFYNAAALGSEEQSRQVVVICLSTAHAAGMLETSPYARYSILCL